MGEEERLLYEDFKVETDPFKKAEILYKLSNDIGIKLNDIGKKIDLSPSYISHILRLKKIPELIIDGFYSKLVTITHLFILSRLHEAKDMIEVYENILSKNLTTLETDDLIRQKLYGIKSEGEYLNREDKEKLIANFNKLLGGETKIIQTRVKSKINIELKGNLLETTSKLKKFTSDLNKD